MGDQIEILWKSIEMVERKTNPKLRVDPEKILWGVNDKLFNSNEVYERVLRTVIWYMQQGAPAGSNRF